MGASDKSFHSEKIVKLIIAKLNWPEIYFLDKSGLPIPILACIWNLIAQIIFVRFIFWVY